MALPDGVVNAVCGAFFGSLLASASVNWLTQRWIERREARAKRDELRLELYLEIVDRVVANEERRAKWSGKPESEPIESQQNSIRLRHRLVLLGSSAALATFTTYEMRLFKRLCCNDGEAPDGIDVARDALIRTLQCDIRGVPVMSDWWPGIGCLWSISRFCKHGLNKSDVETTCPTNQKGMNS